MDLAIFWLLLLLSFKLPSCVFTLTINLDRVSLETPIWIMPKADKAGDRMRISKNRSGPNYSYLSDSIQPFINWNGVLKMVIPVHRSAGISNDKDVIPDVYNWDTMPQYHRTLSTSGMCNNDEEYNYYWYDFSKVSLIALGLLFVIVTICILVCSCLKCHHNPKCKHFKDNTIHESKSCYSTITCTKNVNTI